MRELDDWFKWSEWTFECDCIEWYEERLFLRMTHLGLFDIDYVMKRMDWDWCLFWFFQMKGWMSLLSPLSLVVSLHCMISRRVFLWLIDDCLNVLFLSQSRIEMSIEVLVMFFGLPKIDTIIYYYENLSWAFSLVDWSSVQSLKIVLWKWTNQLFLRKKLLLLLSMLVWLIS